MTRDLTFYGYSDDLIEVEGALCEEFPLKSDDEHEPDYVAVSDGTVLSVAYAADGFWRINRVATGWATYNKVEGTDEDDDYSDRVTLSGGSFDWVVHGVKFHAVKR